MHFVCANLRFICSSPYDTAISWQQHSTLVSFNYIDMKSVILFRLQVSTV